MGYPVMTEDVKVRRIIDSCLIPKQDGDPFSPSTPRPQFSHVLHLSYSGTVAHEHVLDRLRCGHDHGCHPELILDHSGRLPQTIVDADGGGDGR